MVSLLEASSDPSFPLTFVAVGSNKTSAAGLEVARQKGVATFVQTSKGIERETYDQQLHERLIEHGVEFVCLAGFMRLLTPWFCEQWQGKMINIHPSLLPLFKGLDTHAAALKAGVRIHGCTVHHVTAGMDEGPIIGQAAVPVRADDTEASLAQRVLMAEHQLYPAAIRALFGHASTFNTYVFSAG